MFENSSLGWIDQKIIPGNTNSAKLASMPIQLNSSFQHNYLIAFKSLQTLNLELTLKEKELAEAIWQNTENEKTNVKILNKRPNIAYDYDNCPLKYV